MKKIELSIASIWNLVLLFVFWSSVSLGQLVRFSMSTITVYPHDFITIILCAQWVLSQRNSIGKLSKWLKKNQLVLFVIGWVGIGWAKAYIQNELGSTAVLITLRLVVYAIACLQLNQIAQRYLPLFYNKSIVFFTAFLMSGWGIIQYLLVPDTRFLHILGWDDHYYRLIGPLFDPNFAGLVALIALWNWQNLSADPTIYSFLNKKIRVINLIITTISLMALTMTFSRSSWLALLSSCFVSLIFTKPIDRPGVIKRSLGWVVGVISCFLLLSKPTGEGVDITRTASVSARTSLSEQLISSWTWSDWIIGRGLFNVRPNIDDLAIAQVEKIPNTSRQPDNIFILLIGSIGLGGLFLVALTVQKLIGTKWFSTYNAPLLTAWFIHAQFNNSFFQHQLWILLVTFMMSNRQEIQRKSIAEINR